MLPYDVLKNLIQRNDNRIVLLVLDGLGGLPVDGKTALEVAETPNMDGLAKGSSLGLAHPVDVGITPGSGPAHLALFGYDPLSWEIGRGVLECLGVDMELRGGDIAIRGNFCTVDEEGIVVDRRAGRIEDGKAKRLCEMLDEAICEIDGVEVTVKHVKEHRLAIRLRGEGLSGGLPDTDPQVEGKKPLEDFEDLEGGKGRTAEVLKKFLSAARDILKKAGDKANYVLLRGISEKPSLPSMGELFGIKPAAIATYPMYRGISRLVGMDVLDTGETIEDEISTLGNAYGDYDFFYVHVKKTDTYGEDGNFAMKIRVIEEVDRAIPKILKLSPFVFVITGDHSTPAVMSGHSFHPVPFLLKSPISRGCDVQGFSERECIKGDLGVFYMRDAMQLMLAHAMKLKKFGA